MATTNTRVLRDKEPENQEGISELPDGATAADMALLQAVKSGQRVIRKSTGKPVTVEELEAELAEKSANKSAQPATKKPAKKKTNKGGDKYDGLSREELIAMHQEAQKKIGEQGQEVGQLRSLTDKLLDLKRTDDLAAHGGSPEESPISGDTLLTNPRDTINSVVEGSERLQTLEQQVQALSQSSVEKEFERLHPTYKQDMEDPDFQEWVRSSPYRSNLAQKAMKLDWEAAHELWTAYDEVRDQVSQDDAAGGNEGQGEKVETDEVDRRSALAAAQMVSAAGSPGDASGKPIYSRQALINKRIQDPAGYYDPAFQDVIKEAYLEGRVK